MGYIGNEPTTGHFPVDNFTSSGGSTYTLTRAPASAGAIEVSVQGVLQPTTAYTVSGSTLTMAGVTSGVKIFVRHLGETLSLPTPADGSVTTAKLGTNSVDGTKIAMGSDARGDILYHGATDYARLAKGTSGQVLTMGANDPAWAAAGGGKINQVIIASNSTLLDLSSATYTDSGLTASITPSAANSRILIHYEMQGTGNGTNHGWGTQIARDIASGGYSTLANSNHGTLFDISTGVQTNYRMRGAYNFMDTTHNSTGVVSYKIQVGTYGGRRIEFTEDGGGATCRPTYIILWEILA